MYAVNVAITFTINIEPMAAGIPTDVSLILVEPDGTSTYDLDGTTIGAVYVAPTSVLPGTYTFTKTFTTAGTWTITLADGTATSYTNVETFQIFIEQSETTLIHNADFTLPG